MVQDQAARYRSTDTDYGLEAKRNTPDSAEQSYNVVGHASS
jgi:hypothetical protein